MLKILQFLQRQLKRFKNVFLVRMVFSLFFYLLMRALKHKAVLLESSNCEGKHEDKSVLVTFSREGEPEGVSLATNIEYRARVENGPVSIFKSPWDQERLEKIVLRLRNKDPKGSPTEQYEVGAELGRSLEKITDLQHLLAEGNVTIYLQLDYPD